MVEENISEWAEKFFDKKLSEEDFGDFFLFLCRRDGVVLYKTGNYPFEGDSDSIGVLMSGAWQASEMVSSLSFPHKTKNSSFRFTFDISLEGIYILPLLINSSQYYMGTLYYNQINPGLLKQRLRNLVDVFKDEIGTFEKGQKEKESFLFQNITDEEMSDIFSF
jgi:hypothetical protein